jgi:hypothetical protein
MYSKSQFHALEVMCRQRAAAARKELEYWLTEAEEWSRVKLHAGQSPVGSDDSSMICCSRTRVDGSAQ